MILKRKCKYNEEIIARNRLYRFMCKNLVINQVFTRLYA